MVHNLCFALDELDIYIIIFTEWSFSEKRMQISFKFNLNINFNLLIFYIATKVKPGLFESCFQWTDIKTNFLQENGIQLNCDFFFAS